VKGGVGWFFCELLLGGLFIFNGLRELYIWTSPALRVFYLFLIFQPRLILRSLENQNVLEIRRHLKNQIKRKYFEKEEAASYLV
jgi:hypothetical protein